MYSTRGGGGGGVDSDFCLLRGSDIFFFFKILNFAFFVCQGFVNYFYGYANLSRYFLGYVIFHSIFWGVL